MAIGAKVYETRSWGTKYRGPIAIHAAKGFPEEVRHLCVAPPFNQVLHDAGFTTLRHLIDVTGHIVCVVDLVDVLPTHGTFVSTYRFAASTIPGAPIPAPAPHEEHFGNYSAGRFAWATRNLRRLATPVKAKGAQGLREIPFGGSLHQAVLEQLGAAA
jgi:hypothetical protein